MKSIEIKFLANVGGVFATYIQKYCWRTGITIRPNNYTGEYHNDEEMVTLHSLTKVLILIKITQCHYVVLIFLQNGTTDFDETLHVAWV